MVHFFLRNLCGQPVLLISFFTRVIKVGCMGKGVTFILLYDKCRALPQRLEECCHATNTLWSHNGCVILSLLNYLTI